MSEKILKRIKEIESDEVHGASQLTLKALDLLKLASAISDANTHNEFIKSLEKTSLKLICARPNMASLENSVSLAFSRISKKTKRTKDISVLKKISTSTINDLIKEISEARKNVSENVASLIEQNDKIMTCSYSSTICNSLIFTKRVGKNFKVNVAESLSQSGKISHGRNTCRELRSNRINFELIADNIVNESVSNSDKVMVGADRVLSNGSLINGKPTLELAKAANYYNVPFYVVCETNKFNTSFRTFSISGDDFEEVPPKLINATITEIGIMNSNEVKNFIKKSKKNS